jgi:hypothetical protein
MKKMEASIMRCPNCGKRIPKDSPWCDNCGYQKETFISDTGKQSEGSPAETVMPQVGNRKKRDVNVPRIIMFSVIGAFIIIPIVLTSIAVTGSIQQMNNAFSSFEISFPISEETAEAGVTLDNYDKIYPEMPYKKVVQLFGAEGTVSESNGNDITYTWKNGDAIVTIEFKDGRAVSKTRSGLK